MSCRRRSLLAGLRAIAPIAPSVIPFGLIVGVAAMDAGLSPAAALGMSVLVFAGASQLAALQLIADGAVPAVVILTALVINLRLLMYSASLAPHFAHLPRGWKWALAYLLTDQAYAVSIHRFLREPEMGERHWYFLGAGFPMWFAWVVAIAVGIWAGAAVPAGWSLEFAVPLIFLALLLPSVYDRPTAVAAVVGGTVATALHGVPFHLGLSVGAVAGMVAGLLAARRRNRATTTGEA